MHIKLAPRLGLMSAAAALCLVLVPAALAAKGGGGGSTTSSTSTITGPVLVYDANGNGLPNWNDTVTFNVSTTATTQPYVNLLCYQNGVSVYNSWRGYFPGSLDTNWNFELSSGEWTSGAASCTANLDMYVSSTRYKVLASLSFHVDG
jgi:hypothetical protein